MKPLRSALVHATIMVVAVSPWLMAQSVDPADIVLINGKVYEPALTQASAIAIHQQRIVAIGSENDVRRWIGPNTEVIDAQGGAITPGMNDAHVHFHSGSLSLNQVDLLAAETLDQIETQIRDFAKAHSERRWVLGRGWLYGAFPDGLPTKELLDRCVPDRPAMMRCYDGHTLWCNSKAMELAGVDSDTHDPVGGIIVKDEKTGEPTGVFKESAQALIDSIIPQPTRTEKLSAFRQGIELAHRLGITSVHEAGIGQPELDIVDSLRMAGDLPLRYVISLDVRPEMTDQDADMLDHWKRKYSELDIIGVKMFVDGVIEAHTAALLAPYANRPTRGLPEYRVDDLNRIVAMLDQRGWQIMIHAIGDGGIRMALDAIEKAAKQNGAPAGGRRHRLEHIESISLEDIPRFGELGVIASMQPMHANPNGNIFNVWGANLGEDRASRAWCWRSIASAGGRLAFGTDWPVVGLDPREGLHVAIHRQTLQGQPPEGFIPQQKMTRLEALEAFTRGSAFAQFADHERGSLSPGRLADVVVWSHDWPSGKTEVLDAHVRWTIFDGRVVYRLNSTK